MHVLEAHAGDERVEWNNWYKVWNSGVARIRASYP